MNLRDTSTFKAKDVAPDEPVDFLPMSAVSADLTTACATEQRPFSEVQKGYTNFADGDVLLAKITPCFENGKIAFAKINTKYGFGSTEFHVVRADKDRLDGRYLIHFRLLTRSLQPAPRQRTPMSCAIP